MLGLFACLSLSACPESNTLTLNEGVLSIPNSSYENCMNIKAINLPQSLISIDSRAFYGC